MNFVFDSDVKLYQIAVWCPLWTRIYECCCVALIVDCDTGKAWMVWNMAKAELGLKRTCLSCGMRYYDFNRTPIICPGCQTAFDPEQVVRSRRGRAVPKSGGKAEKADALTASEEVVTPDEEEAETTEETSASEDGDGDVEFEGDDIDVSNDDSAGLIADDLDEEDEILPGIPADDE